MLKELKSSLTKLFDKKIITLAFFLIILFGLWSYSNSKNHVYDRMTTGTLPTSDAIIKQQDAPISAPNSNSGSQYSLQPVANPSDLLPKDGNSQWASLNPISQGNVAIPDLLQSGYHIGLDTIGQTLKNPNYQIRSDPIIEKKDIGPWQQSTIEPDYGRIPLETR
jgi:hypothetical protein